MSHITARLTLPVHEDDRKALVEHLRQRLPKVDGWTVESRYAEAVVKKSMHTEYLFNGAIDVIALVADRVAREGLKGWPHKIVGKTLVSTRYIR